MGTISWVKLDVKMFDDEKIKAIRSMPSGSELCLIWIQLIALAGKTNDRGQIYLSEDIPYTEGTLANSIGHSTVVVHLALETFRKLGMITLLANDRIALLNWEKHQNVESLEKVREQTRLRTQRYRQKLLACDATVTSRNAIESESEGEVEQEKKESPTIAPVPRLVGGIRSEPKTERASLVLLTDSEMDKLEKEYGVKNTQAAIKKLSAFKLSKGKRYKSDYGAILSWAMRSVLEKGAVPDPTTGSRREVEVIDQEYFERTGKFRTKREER